MRAVERSLRYLIVRLVGLLVLAVAAVAPATASAASDPANNRSLSHATDLSCSEDPTGDACVGFPRSPTSTPPMPPRVSSRWSSLAASLRCRYRSNCSI